MDNGNKYESLDQLIGFPSNNSFLTNLLKKVQVTSSSARKSKIVSDHQYFLSQDKNYEATLNKTSTRIENLILKLMNFVDPKEEGAPQVNIRKNFDSVCDFVDNMLEKVNDNMDILKGIRKEKKDEEIENELKTIKNKGEKSTPGLKVRFTDPLCDNTYHHFIPKLKVKHNKIIDLSEEILREQIHREQNYSEFSQILFSQRAIAYNAKILENPYYVEITTFFSNFIKRVDTANDLIKEFLHNNQNNGLSERFVKSLLNSNIISNIQDHTPIQRFKADNTFYKVFFCSESPNADQEIITSIANPPHYKYKALNETDFLYVQTYEEWKTLLEELKDQTEIAVDLEHHHLESYIGVVCLMQISTRFKDYVVDTIKLREYMHEINEIFTDPKILKVLHGADYDVMWLQRDFGVYLVNMFDTGQAAKVLEYQSYGLAHLMLKFCDITANKVHQKDDWRIRPLTDEMLKYAREDTHYLLYIYDCIKKQLIVKAFNSNRPIFSSFAVVMEKSRDLCLKKYFKPEIKDIPYYGHLSRNAITLSKTQISMFKVIYKFRDYVARKVDCYPESVIQLSKVFAMARLPNPQLEDLYKICEKSQMRSFVPELKGYLDQKLEKIQKIKEKKDNSLENYLNNVRGKLQSGSTLKNEVLSNRIQSFASALPKKKESGKNLFTKDVETLSSNIEISFQPKSKVSNFWEAKEEKMSIDKPNQNFDKVIEKFQNFNLVTFLKEKRKLNLRIAPIRQTPQIEFPSKENVNIITPINMDTKAQSLSEKFLGTKRATQIDLTAIDQVPKQEVYSEESEEEKNKEEFINIEETRNLKASSKFIDSMLKKGGEVKTFKQFKPKQFNDRNQDQQPQGKNKRKHNN